MTTLATEMLRVADCLGIARYSTTTAAGAVTTLIDTTRDEPVDWWNGGTLWFVSGALAGKTAVITDWALTGTTFTFATQSDAPGSGSRYAAADKRWTKADLLAAVNDAMRDLGAVTAEYNNAAFIVVEDQLEYDLPSGVANVVRVQIATDTAAPWNFTDPVRQWVETTGHITFHQDMLYWLNAYEDHRIRLFYNPTPTELTADTDTIPWGYEEQRLAWEAAWYACSRRIVVAENSEPNTSKLLALIEQKRRQMAKTPVRRMTRDSRMSGW